MGPVGLSLSDKRQSAKEKERPRMADIRSESNRRHEMRGDWTAKGVLARYFTLNELYVSISIKYRTD